MKMIVALLLGYSSALTLRSSDAPEPLTGVFGYAFAGTYAAANAGFL